MNFKNFSYSDENRMSVKLLKVFSLFLQYHITHFNLHFLYIIVFIIIIQKMLC